jgi:aspartyl-tRNA(Asn)/glutamyl-tRNA(Gln) amidotransferase subunit A
MSMTTTADHLFYAPVTELAAKIRTKQISSVELTRAFLDRSESLGPRFSAYVTVTRDRALEKARAADRELAAGKYRGPLHGIPYAAKDLLAVKGYPTTWGAKPFANQKFDFDAAVIERLDRAGAVLIGKAAMIELAGGMGYRFGSASITGAAKNPWKETCWTCGSSSGSGAVAAAALAPFAIGTETWGSIICPSAYCGVTGLRPTFGRVSRYGAMALSYSMDKIGPLSRTAGDCAVVLEAIAGHDPRDLSSLPPSEAGFRNAPRVARPLRITVLTNAWKKPDPDIQKSFVEAIQVLKHSGAHIAEATLPEGPWEEAAGTIVSVEGAAAFRSLIESGGVADLTDPLGKISGYVNEEISADDYMRALQIRTIVQQRVDALFDGCDVISAPSLPITATPLETNLETDLSFADPLGGIGNLCGLPAISVPCGFSSKNLPIGLQFAARVRKDAAVVAAAAQFQAHTDWHTRRPPIE